MASVSTQAAEALYPVLSTFQSVQGHALRSIRQVLIDGSLEKLIFDFGPVILTVKANEDDDTVDLSLSPLDHFTIEGNDVTDVQPWRDFVGRSFSWGWLIMNQQGYMDGFY